MSKIICQALADLICLGAFVSLPVFFADFVEFVKK